MADPVDYAALAEQARHPAPVDYAALAAQVRGEPMVASHAPAPAGGQTWGHLAAETLPIAGGMIGGATGSVPGAMLGGAAGEGYRQLAEHASELPGAAVDTARNLFTQPGATLRGFAQGAAQGATDAGLSGAIQGGLELGGQFAGRLMKAGAGRLYQSVLKPTKVLRAEYPNLVQVGLEHGVPVSTGGAATARDLMQTSKEAADALVTNAAGRPNAPTIDPRQAVAGITDAVKEVKNLPVARPNIRVIGDYGRSYLSEHPGPMTLEQANAGVRATDKFFNPAYRATMDRGNPITNGQTAAALGINNETRSLLRQAVPGLQAQNATTSNLYGLTKAIEARTATSGNNSVVGMQHLINAGIGAGTGAVGGREKGLSAFIAAEALTNPMIASRIAINAGRAGEQPLAQLVRAALIAKLAGDKQVGSNDEQK